MITTHNKALLIYGSKFYNTINGNLPNLRSVMMHYRYLFWAACALLLLADLVFANPPYNPQDGCTKTEYTDEVYVFVAPYTGTFTFKGGSVHSPNGYFVTIRLTEGESWVAPGASISFVIGCPDGPPDPPDGPPDQCIYKDPAKITSDYFKFHGMIKPLTDMAPDVEKFTFDVFDQSAVAVDIDLPNLTQTHTSRYKYKDAQTTVRLRRRLQNGVVVWGVKVRQRGIFISLYNPITVAITVGDDGFVLETDWQQIPQGWQLKNRYYICKEPYTTTQSSFE